MILTPAPSWDTAVIEAASRGHLSLSLLQQQFSGGCQAMSGDLTCQLPLSGLKVECEKSRAHGWAELYGHCCFLQIQITFGNHLHQTQTEGSPGLQVQNEMDYQVASFLTVEKHHTQEQGLGNFGFLLDHNSFPNWVVKEG